MDWLRKIFGIKTEGMSVTIGFEGDGNPRRTSKPAKPRQSRQYSGGGNALVVDVETTGIGSYERIVSFAAVRLENWEIVDDPIHLIFDPARTCSPKATEIHGYTDWYLRHQPKFREHAEEISHAIRSAPLLVAHNFSFDAGFIQRDLKRAKAEVGELSGFCTMRQYRTVYPGQKSSLDACLASIGMRRQGARHGALEDAALAACLYGWLNDQEIHIPEGYLIPPTNARPAPPEPEGGAPPRRPGRKKAETD